MRIHVRVERGSSLSVHARHSMSLHDNPYCGQVGGSGCGIIGRGGLHPKGGEITSRCELLHDVSERRGVGGGGRHGAREARKSFSFSFSFPSAPRERRGLAVLGVRQGVTPSVVLMLVRIASEATRAARRLTHAKPPTRHECPILEAKVLATITSYHRRDR